MNQNSLIFSLYFLLVISLHTSNAQQLKQLFADNSPDQLQTNYEEIFPSFSQYVKDFDKNYTSEEYAKREKIYKVRVHELIELQRTDQIDYFVGPTKFTDQSKDENDARKKILIDQDSKKSFLKQPKRLAQNTNGLPTSIDWRDSAVTSIKDQSSCGACWTFATAAYGQSRLILKKTHTKQLDLSEQYLLSCTSQCSCDGGYLEYVFQKAAGGIPLESDYPYQPGSYISPFICWTGKKIQIGYIPQKQYDLSEIQLKKLLQQGPVAISVSATNWEDYTGGIFSCKPFDKINHAVLLVGYTPNYWLIKNQWGVKWGQKGYIRVTTNKLYNCKIGTSAFYMWENFRIHLLLITILTVFVIFL